MEIFNISSVHDTTPIPPEGSIDTFIITELQETSILPYSKASIHTGLFVVSLLFFIFFILIIASITQCKRSLRIPHEEFVLVQTSAVPSYMTIVDTRSHPGTDFHLYPRNQKPSSSNNINYNIYPAQDKPPSYQSTVQNEDPPTYQSANEHLRTQASTTESSTTPDISQGAVPKRQVSSNNPFLKKTVSDSKKSIDADAENFTDDEVFYEASSCTSAKTEVQSSENKTRSK
ncbi:uncharacterized protein LOC125178928 [Hyalella azteca]|uniref:Uncharacterized protein LOC125178928 n=1 Tax=Hyalella azteca TaxID=294128 RepID=A0A979FRL0_HYAAZ|nr:uncharacterized protein LOC125178928 [Hyalella azteca]